MSGPRRKPEQAPTYDFEIGNRRYVFDNDPGKWSLRQMRTIQTLFGSPIEALSMLESIMASMVVSVAKEDEISLPDALDKVDTLPYDVFVDLADKVQKDAEEAAKAKKADPTKDVEPVGGDNSAS
jgi:hypothetical protein